MNNLGINSQHMWKTFVSETSSTPERHKHRLGHLDNSYSWIGLTQDKNINYIYI